MTLSVPDEVHRRMREHPEIRWTEIMRQALIRELEALEQRPFKRMRGYPTRRRLKRRIFVEERGGPRPDFEALGL